MATDRKPSSWTEEQEAAFQALQVREEASYQPVLPPPAPATSRVPLAHAPQSRRGKKPDSPTGQILAGFFLSWIGAGLVVASTNDWYMLAGVAVTTIGALLAMIGTIAAGVRLGVNLARWDKQTES